MGEGRKQNGTASKFKRNGYLRFTAKAILYILGSKRKVLSRNNVEYDKPLYSISFVGEEELGGQVKREFTVSLDRCSSV